MAISTYTLEQIIDICVGEGAPDPRNLPSGFGDSVAVQIGTDALADLIAERFNWKWNRGVAAPFLTNSWQQDYPQPAQAAGPIGWGEDCDITDINNTVIPKPLNWDGALTWRKQLTRTSIARWRPNEISWMYNSDLSWGTWPGAGVTFYPLLTNGANQQNPIMNFIDANGNYLILTSFGTTGMTQPEAAANAAEGTTVNDGSCVWTVVSGNSQGFRLDALPNATGPVYQISPYYQVDPPRLVNLQSTISPVPDSFIRHFRRGYTAGCFSASPNPQLKEKGEEAKIDWLNALEKIIDQGNREPDVYGLVPANSVVEPRWGWRGPRTADQPF